MACEPFVDVPFGAILSAKLLLAHTRIGGNRVSRCATYTSPAYGSTATALKCPGGATNDLSSSYTWPARAGASSTATAAMVVIAKRASDCMACLVDPCGDDLMHAVAYTASGVRLCLWEALAAKARASSDRCRTTTDALTDTGRYVPVRNLQFHTRISVRCPQWWVVSVCSASHTNAPLARRAGRSSTICQRAGWQGCRRVHLRRRGCASVSSGTPQASTEGTPLASGSARGRRRVLHLPLPPAGHRALLPHSAAKGSRPRCARLARAARAHCTLRPRRAPGHHRHAPRHRG